MGAGHIHPHIGACAVLGPGMAHLRTGAHRHGAMVHSSHACVIHALHAAVFHTHHPGVAHRAHAPMVPAIHGRLSDRTMIHSRHASTHGPHHVEIGREPV